MRPGIIVEELLCDRKMGIEPVNGREKMILEDGTRLFFKRSRIRTIKSCNL